MGSHHHDPHREANERSGTPRQEHPGSGPGPVYHRPGSHWGHIPRERCAGEMAWPIGANAELPHDDEAAARHNLEQVGHILRRMELDQLDIVQLRTETRAMLAELAA